MQTRNRRAFASIHTEGALLPVELLQRISENDKGLEELHPESYHLAPGEKVNETINRAWNRLSGLWVVFKAARIRLGSNDPGTTVTRERWLLPLFQELGFGRLSAAKAVEIEGKTYPISHVWRAANTTVPLHLVGCGIELDKRTPGAAGASRSSPHSLMQEYLNRLDDLQWGVVSNGLGLRILRDNATLTRQAYIEFDLETLFDGEIYSDFVILWLLCHQSRFEIADKQTDSRLEKWSKSAQASGTRALDELRRGVEKSIECFGRCFLQHPANGELRSKLEKGQLSTQDYYRQLLRLVYRLIFLFVAEDRGLLLVPDAAVEARQRYQNFYSTMRLRAVAERQRGSRHHDRYESLRLVMRLLGSGSGCAELGIPALGGFLFSARATADLNDAKIDNVALLGAVRWLAFINEGKIRRAVDYRNLGPEELGSVYESLLEMHPQLHTEAGTFELSSAAGNERKTTGSYYTPSSLILVLLDSALDPVIESCLKGKRDAAQQEVALLGLKVCDPACGSGHFLVAAAHRLARRLATVRTGEGEPAPEATRSALRSVISNCIYGVDINPMSVELCKVSLWMEALEPGKPLSFLDGHIKCGNSLLGIPLRNKNGNVSLSHLTSIPDEALKEVIKEDSKTQKEIQNRIKKNKEENKRITTQRFGQLALPGSGWGVLEPEKIQKAFDGILEQRLLLEKSDAELSAIESIALANEKEKILDKIENSRTSLYWKLRQSLNLWCAIWFWGKSGKIISIHDKDGERKIEVPDVPTTQKYLELVSSLDSPELSDKYKNYFDILDHLVSKHHFFHWELEFPEVWQKLSKNSDQEADGFDVIIGNPPWEVPEAEPREFSASLYPEISDLNRGKFKKWFENQLKQDLAFKVIWLEVVRERNLLVRGYKNLIPEGNRIVREANPYKGFILRSVWAKPKRFGFIVPSSFHTDASTLPLREVTLLSCQSSLVAITNDALIFPSLPAIFRFDIFACDFEDKNRNLSIVYLPAATQNHLQAEYIKQKTYHLTSDIISQLSPGILSIPEFQDKDSYNIATKAYRNGVALGNLEPVGKVLFRKEAYNTNEHDAGVFVLSNWTAPFCEGSTVKPYLWNLSSAEKGYEEDVFNSRFQGHQTVFRWRLAFKLIVSQSNVRRMQVCLAPPKTVFGQNVPTLSIQDASTEDLLNILGVLNSFVFEYLVRMKTGAALSKPVLMSLPIPKNAFTNSFLSNYVKIALVKKENQPQIIINYLKDESSNNVTEYYQARATIDTLVALAYGLSEAEYASVLRVFNLLDKDQPALPNEERSFITRDFAFLEYFRNQKKEAPIDVSSYFQINNNGEHILDLEYRVMKAFELGARPYAQSNLDAENDEADASYVEDDQE